MEISTQWWVCIYRVQVFSEYQLKSTWNNYPYYKGTQLFKTNDGITKGIETTANMTERILYLTSRTSDNQLMKIQYGK
jgi:hypothetical protein